MTDANPRFATIEDCATRLKVAPLTVRRWMDEGRVPYIRIGSSLRIPERFFHLLEQQAMNELKSAGSDSKAEGGDTA